MGKLTADDEIAIECYVGNRKDSIFKSGAFCMEKTSPVVISVPVDHNFLMVINDE